MLLVFYSFHCVPTSHHLHHSGSQKAAGIILWMRPANERQRYIVTSSLIGWAYTQDWLPTEGIPRAYLLDVYLVRKVKFTNIFFLTHCFLLKAYSDIYLDVMAPNHCLNQHKLIIRCQCDFQKSYSLVGSVHKYYGDRMTILWLMRSNFVRQP